MTSEESLQVSRLTYGLSEFYSICLGFFRMEYENDDTTDIPEIDLNICVAVQPFSLSRWTEIAVVVLAVMPSAVMKNVADQVLKVVSKSSFDVNTH